MCKSEHTLVYILQDYLLSLQLLNRKSTNPNVATLGICACQFDLQLWSTFYDFIMSVSLDHVMITIASCCHNKELFN